MFWFCFLVPPLLMAFALSLDGLEARLLGRRPREDNETAGQPTPAASPQSSVRRHRTARTRRRRAPAPGGPRMLARLHSPR